MSLVQLLLVLKAGTWYPTILNNSHISISINSLIQCISPLIQYIILHPSLVNADFTFQQIYFYLQHEKIDPIILVVNCKSLKVVSTTTKFTTHHILDLSCNFISISLLKIFVLYASTTVTRLQRPKRIL